jgi:hypothetical protein
MTNLNIEKYIEYLDEQIKLYGVELEKFMNTRELLLRHADSLPMEREPARLAKPEKKQRAARANRDWRGEVITVLKESAEPVGTRQIATRLGSTDSRSIHRIGTALWSMHRDGLVDRIAAPIGGRVGREQWLYSIATNTNEKAA